MKNRLLIFASLVGAALAFGSCSNYLDETADRSGNAYIYHIDQLDGLMADPTLYFGGSIDFPQASTGGFMQEQYLMGDGVSVSPEFYAIGRPTYFMMQTFAYSTYSWDGTDLKTHSYVPSLTWNNACDKIYTFNTVLENLDNVQQTTRTTYDQVKGEACFGRAFYHFLLLTQYCLWQDDAPGIGYREDTDPAVIPERQTVAYTLSRIYEDLDRAEEALTAAGRTAFDFDYSSRPTVPTVQALRARIALYRGDYETALTNAENALAGNSELVDVATNPNNALTPLVPITFLDQDSAVIEEMTVYEYWPMVKFNLYNQAVLDAREILLPCMSGDVSTWGIPLSESFYNLFTDKVNDARWTYYYANNYPIRGMATVATEISSKGGIFWDTWHWLEPWDYCCYWNFTGQWGATNVVGMTTAEMYLTQAECLARAGRTDEAAEVLRTLRRTRFTDQSAADNIGGTVQEVLDERSREMGPFWRFYEAKRLNGAENAGIEIRREVLTDISDLNSVTEVVIPADDPRWALPFYQTECDLMGWEQNPGWD